MCKKLQLPQRNESYNNTLTQPCCVVSYSVAWNTPVMHIYKMKSVTRKRWFALYINIYIYTHTHKKLRFHKRNETYATQKDGSPTINFLHKSVAELHLHASKSSVVSTIWNSRPVIGPSRSHGHRCDLRLLWHLLSAAGNICLSIQSVVHVATFRCHFFVAHSAYPSFTGVRGTMDHRGTTSARSSLFAVRLHHTLPTRWSVLCPTPQHATYPLQTWRYSTPWVLHVVKPNSKEYFTL